MPYFRRSAVNTLNADGTPLRNHPYRQPGTTMNISLSDKEMANGCRCVGDFKKQWSLDSSNPVVFTQTAKKRTDSNPNTLIDYQRGWNECYLFSVRLGCWRTATLMSAERPRNPLPAVPKTIRHYWMWKCTPKSSPVRERSRSRNNKREGAELKWADGTVMYGCGAWNSPGCVTKSNTALGLLHECHTNLNNVFEEECHECKVYNPNVDFSKGIVGSTLMSCHDHIGRPLLKPRGNAMHDTAVANELRNLKQELGETHEVKGNFQLTPSQVREIRRELLQGSNKGAVATIGGTQLYIMILLGVKLFGRSDDVCTVKLGDFPKGHGNVGIFPFTVRYVSVYFKGKNQNHYTLLRLFKDDICPEFCIVRHLLAYLHVAGIEGANSFLFPKLKDLQAHMVERETNSNLKKKTFDTHVPKANLHDRMKVNLRTDFNIPYMMCTLY